MVADRDWRLWFVQLSGWPVFLVTVGAAILFAVVVAIVLTRFANRSIAQNIVTAGMILATEMIGLLAVFALVSRL